VSPLVESFNWRHWSVPRFVRRMSRRHPELERQVLWSDFMAMCAREQILVRFEHMSAKARLVRYGADVFIQLNRRLDVKLPTIYGMHELCHFWRDDPGEQCYYADDYSQHPREEFADIFAWYVTTSDRPRLREEPW
jgi:hypothetical protein